MADPTPEVTNALVRLMTSGDDLSAMSDDELVNALLALRERKKLEGSAAAELHRRDWTWPRIAGLLGVDQSTVHRWAQPYLRAGEDRI